MIPTRVDRDSEAFHTNASYMRGLVDELKDRLALVAQGGGDDAGVGRHTVKRANEGGPRDAFNLGVRPEIGDELLELNAVRFDELGVGERSEARSKQQDESKAARNHRRILHKRTGRRGLASA